MTLNLNVLAEKEGVEPPHAAHAAQLRITSQHTPVPCSAFPST
jgi:hypothetical protein